MKKIASILVVLILIISISNFGAVQARENFTDLGSVSWAEAAIYFLNERGVINGYGNGVFAPGDNITREQAALMLVRELYPNETSSTKLGFSDVNSNSFYYNAIAVAVDHQLFGGYDNNTFKPGNPITRAETAKILALAYDLKGEGSSFIDLNTAPWAVNFVSALSANKITDGYPDGTFKPNNSITRAEFSLLLARILDDKFKPKPADVLTEERIATLISKANEIGMSQDFTPYFTDNLLNNMQNVIVEQNNRFKSKDRHRLYYNVNNTPLIIQTIEGNFFTSTLDLTRTLIIKQSNGVWKIDEITFFERAPHNPFANG